MYLTFRSIQLPFALINKVVLCLLKEYRILLKNATIVPNL